MFDLAWSEILLVGVVALLVVGPKELPDLLRTVGRWMRKARSMASNFQSTFDQMMRDEELAKTRQDLERAMSGDPALPKPSYAVNPRPQPEEEEDWDGDEVANAVADVTKETDAAAKAAEAKVPVEAEKPPAGSTGA